MASEKQKLPSIEKKFAEVKEKVRQDDAKDARGLAILERGKLAIQNRELEQRVRDLIQENGELSIQVERVKLVEQGAHETAVGLQQRVQQLERVIADKEKQSRTDVLTGLLNRYAFETLAPTMFETYQSLVRESYHQVQGGAKSAINATFNAVYIDLNDFKPINDTVGHAAGDLALKQVAAALRAAVRGTDKIFRMGGDEFLVLFIGHEEPVKGVTTVVEDRGIIAARIARALERTGFESDGKTVSALTASIGAVVAHPDESLTDLIARADGAAYRAKSKKKPGVSGLDVEGVEENGKK